MLPFIFMCVLLRQLEFTGKHLAATITIKAWTLVCLAELVRCRGHHQLLKYICLITNSLDTR